MTDAPRRIIPLRLHSPTLSPKICSPFYWNSFPRRNRQFGVPSRHVYLRKATKCAGTDTVGLINETRTNRREASIRVRPNINRSNLHANWLVARRGLGVLMTMKFQHKWLISFQVQRKFYALSGNAKTKRRLRGRWRNLTEFFSLVTVSS